MEQSAQPTFEEFEGYVRKYHKRVGLRMIYKKYNIGKDEREKFRKMWDMVEAEPVNNVKV